MDDANAWVTDAGAIDQHLSVCQCQRWDDNQSEWRAVSRLAVPERVERRGSRWLSVPTVTTSNQYDAYLNATQVTVSTPDGFSKTTNNTYTNDPSLWYLGRLTRATVINSAP